jgi:hypothetical protein
MASTQVTSRGAAIACLLAVLGAATPRGDVPHVFARPDGAILIQLPASSLAGDRVKTQLRTGLTTAFALLTKGRDSEGHERKLGARVEIRYELWDENYIVVVFDGTGRRESRTIDSYAHLVDWWSHTPILLGAPSLLRQSGAVAISLEMVPFSPEEEADTQRWLVHSLNTSSSRATSGQGPASPQPSEGLLDIIIGTAIHRQAILSFHWDVPVEASPPK